MSATLIARPCMALVRSSAVSAPCRVSRPTARMTIVRAQQHNTNTSSQQDLTNGTARIAAGLTALTALAPLAAHAEEAVAEAVTEASTSAGGFFGSFGPGEILLLGTPVAVYTAFSVYRDRVNPKASFLDYIYIIATLAIVANLISIVAFKTRFF